VSATVIYACGHSYRRDPDGVWRYDATGAPVPGARDLTLAGVYDFPVRNRRVQVPVRVAESDPALSWCLERARNGTIEVPLSRWTQQAELPIGIDAPELHPDRLMTIEQVAILAGLEEMSIRRYLVADRPGAIPEPPIRIGATPCWPRPIIEHWLATRPRRGRPALSAAR
jgi:hypothetical protein